jgi:hypothetical protein
MESLQADNKPKKVQKLADDHTEPFARVGLKMNDMKTKGMEIDGAKPPTMMSQEAFLDQKRRGSMQGESQSKSAVPTAWSNVTETGACKAPVGRSVQEGQR